jgi:hypothetical protein
MASWPVVQADGVQGALTEYELRQVCAIAAWKGEKPGLAKGLIHRASGSLTRLGGRIIPAAPVKVAIEAVNRAAGRIAKDDSVLKDAVAVAAGVRSLEDVAAQPLEFADGLADRVIADAGGIALGLGAATGAGGPVSVAAGVPAMLFGALRAIHRVSQAYGYAFEPEPEQRLMIGILSLSTAATPEQRQQAMEGYRRQIESSFFAYAVEESAHKALQRAVFGAELGAWVPGFNIAFNAYLNRQFVTRAGVAAKRVFQERWLRDRGKVVWIAPV